MLACTTYRREQSVATKSPGVTTESPGTHKSGFESLWSPSTTALGSRTSPRPLAALARPTALMSPSGDRKQRHCHSCERLSLSYVDLV